MKKIILLLIISTTTLINQAQIQVRPDGNLYFPNGQDVRFGSDANGNNSQWSIEYLDNGLNFWRPSVAGSDYLMFVNSLGFLGLASTQNLSAQIQVNGRIYVKPEQLDLHL